MNMPHQFDSVEFLDCSLPSEPLAHSAQFLGRVLQRLAKVLGKRVHGRIVDGDDGNLAVLRDGR